MTELTACLPACRPASQHAAHDRKQNPSSMSSWRLALLLFFYSCSRNWVERLGTTSVVFINNDADAKRAGAIPHNRRHIRRPFENDRIGPNCLVVVVAVNDSSVVAGVDIVVSVTGRHRNQRCCRHCCCSGPELHRNPIFVSVSNLSDTGNSDDLVSKAATPRFRLATFISLPSGSESTKILAEKKARISFLAQKRINSTPRVRSKVAAWQC